MKKHLIQSIGFKILFFYILLALINVSFVISIIFENQVELISKNSKLETEQQISNLVSSLKQFSSEMKKGSLFSRGSDRKYLKQFVDLIRPNASSFIITTEDNKILYKSNKALEPPQTIIKDILRSITVKNFSGKEYYLRINDKRKIIYCYIPLADFQLGNTVLLVSKDISSIDKSLKNLYYQAIYVIFVALFFHAIFAMVLFRYIITPVRLLKQGAFKLAKGDFDARISLSERNDEFGSLAESFNKMADSISESMITLSGKAKKAIKTRNRTDILTVKDELTGLFSRIYMIERINEEMSRAQIKENSIALIIIDIDDFEDITKIYGTNTGDILVLEISKIITRNSAETDIISRFSREAFAVLTTECSIEQVKDLSEKIRHNIEDKTIITPDGEFSVTASIGASFIDFVSVKKTKAGTNLVFSAGAALAQAKEKGKNRVEIIP